MKDGVLPPQKKKTLADSRVGVPSQPYPSKR